MSSRVEIILENTPFPGAGQEIGGHKVIESMVDVEGKNWAVYIKGKLSQSQVKTALTGLTTTHFALPVQDEYSLVSFKPKGMTHARTNPPGDVTVVRGHMYYARPNPISKTDFHEEMDEMLIDNPEKYFTKYTIKNPEGLHERLWKGVSYAGESYGWKKGNELWHRRASFIMPKIKINKALKGATMFYHTHPSKDEPSLTSADDIQFYLDLHFAWGIKSFYTVMKHKLDHFTITSKKGGEEKYLRMSEDAFIDTVDGMIGKGEEVAKKEVGEDRPEVEFQNRITKEMVDLFNKKFKSIAKISFRPKAKNTASKLARKPATNPLTALVNPAPNPPIKVKDQYVAKALEELKGLDYAHEHYGADEYGHTMYVYWWLKHHLAPTDKQPKGRLFKLNEYGLDSDTRKKLRSYLSQPIIGNYNYMDAVYLLALYHDIAKLREKGVKEPGWEIGAEMFRNEIGPELNLPSKLTEDLAFLFDTDLGRKGIADEDFLTQSGDYYGASKLVQMADMITHHPTMYTKKGGQAYKQEAMVSMINQLRVFLDHHYVIQNPPPQVNTLQWVSDYGIEDIAYEAAEELLGEFHQSVIPDNDGKTKQPNDKSSGGHIYYMRFNNSVLPGLSRTYSASLALSSSKLTIFVASPTPDDLGKKVANDIYQLVGSKLQESYLEIELEVPAPEVQVNPRHAGKIQIISISGPSGGGKSTVLHYLHKHIPNSSIPPTYTTRPRRRSDGADRKFVARTQFNAMLKRGEFVEWDTSGRHFYGRRFKDFLGNVAIIEVSLRGKKHYEKRFANMFTVYLDPDPKVTEEQRAKDIFKRGGLTKEEAKRRAKKATELVEKSKKMQFDLRVTMLKGKYNDGAKKILSEVPLVNPDHDKGFIPLDVGITREEQEEADRLLAENKERIRREEEEAEEERRRYEESLIQDTLPITTEEQELEDELEEAYRDLHDDAPWANPKKDLFDWFEDWAKLINMKNKELKAFLDSDWGKVAGLSPQEAKKLGINSGRTSGRRILAMRKKLGLGGPKDYIKGPRHLEDMYAKAIDKWTGPATKKGTDWYWCTRQVRFNKRFMGDNFGERKGPLVKKQKTQNQPSRRLLSLWVWGHDPWRYARKNGVNRMPKCPDVPWVGMTEKRKYGKIEVIPGPRKNPAVKVVKDEYRSRFIDEDGNDVTSIPVSSIEFKEGVNSVNFGEPITRAEAQKERRGEWLRVSVSAYKGKTPIIEVAPIRFFDNYGESPDLTFFQLQGRKFFKNIKVEGPVYPTILSQIEDEPHAVLIVQGFLRHPKEFEIRDDITDWKGESKGRRFEVYEKAEIVSLDSKTMQWTSRPYKGGFMAELHQLNRTKKKSKQVYNVHMTDEGDHYFMHEVQVAEEFRGRQWLLRAIQRTIFNMPEFLPDYPDKKPIRTLARVVEGIPQEKLVSGLLNSGFEILEQDVDGGVLMEFKWLEDVTTNPTSKWGRDAPPVVLGENLQYMTYTGNTKLPHRLSYQLVKKLRSLLARDREYVGFAKNNKIYYGTSFGVHGAVSQFTEDLNGAEFQFHTHPYGFRKGFKGLVSRADMKYACYLRLLTGLSWTLVVQKRGINMFQTAIREDSELLKALIAANENGWKSKKLIDRFDNLVDKDLEIIENMYNPDMPYRQHLFETEMKLFHPNYHASSELGQELAFIKTLNKFLKGFKFKMWYLEVPSEHWDWTEDMTEAYPLDDSEFSDVADWLRRPRQIRANPHYTPPPGIAMFPGELHQGPAALYQQTISISQLNPPRSKPFPWNKNRVKNSPFKTMKKAQATYDSWKKGNPIGFSANSSLKSMGKIPRASGKYELGEKYERINPPEEHIHWDEYHSHMTDYHVDERQNPAKKACPKPPKKGIIIYGASWCHWCQEAKKYLDEKGKKYKYVDIDEVKDYGKTIYPLTDNYKYIPVVFVDGEFIGGYSELVARKNPSAFTVKKSKIHGKGSFASKPIKKGTIVFSDGTQLRHLNHSDTPNIRFEFPDEIIGVAISDISKGTELFGDYQQLADLTGHPEADKDVPPHTLYNPMAPGYQSYGWTTQDWRSIKVNSKGDIDYSEKCGAEGTRTKSGKPRLCLPAPSYQVTNENRIRQRSTKKTSTKEA